jgi:hypothetical protein
MAWCCPVAPQPPAVLQQAQRRVTHKRDNKHIPRPLPPTNGVQPRKLPNQARGHGMHVLRLVGPSVRDELGVSVGGMGWFWLWTEFWILGNGNGVLGYGGR